MAEFPALPLFTDSYIADTDHLTDTEHGLYLKVLIAMWRSPGCRLPDDDDWLARKFRRDADAVRTDMRPLIREFCDCKGGWITQKRLAREWDWCMKKREKNAASAKSRWEKEKLPCERSASDAVPSECPPPHPTHLQKKEGKPSSSAAVKMPHIVLPSEWAEWAASDRGWDDGITQDVWVQFREYWATGKGRSTKREDWLPTWRNWCRKENIKSKGLTHENTQRHAQNGAGSPNLGGRAGDRPTWRSEGERVKAMYLERAQHERQS